MRKTVVGCAIAAVLAICAVRVWAVENSLVYGPLTKSATFVGRVSYVLAQEAPVILAEAQTGSYTAACHTKRAALAANVAANPDAYASVLSVHLATNINVTTGGALTGSGATLDTPATDAALLAAVASLWSAVSGCITNP